MRIVFILVYLVTQNLFGYWQNLDELYKKVKDIGLNKTQEQKIEKLFKNYHQQLKDWHQLNQDMHNKVISNFTKKDCTHSLKKEFEDTYIKKAQIDLDFFQELHLILTQKQREEFAKNF